MRASAWADFTLAVTLGHGLGGGGVLVRPSGRRRRIDTIGAPKVWMIGSPPSASTSLRNCAVGAAALCVKVTRIIWPPKSTPRFRPWVKISTQLAPSARR
jgi:hypothetical protein